MIWETKIGKGEAATEGGQRARGGSKGQEQGAAEEREEEKQGGSRSPRNRESGYEDKREGQEEEAQAGRGERHEGTESTCKLFLMRSKRRASNARSCNAECSGQKVAQDCKDIGSTAPATGTKTFSFLPMNLASRPL